MLKIGLLIIASGIMLVGVGVALAQRYNNGEDDRPRYYSARNRSLWPYEMPKIVRHGPGRAWINFGFNFESGPALTGSEQPKHDEWLDIVFWSSVPIESLRIFDSTRDQLLLAKDGDELLNCGRRDGSHTLTFPKRYVLCALDVPPNNAKIIIEITDAHVNEFQYVVQLPNYRLAHFETDHR